MSERAQALEAAEAIVRGHNDFCIGHYEDDKPWCSAAPDGTPLCPACASLASTIADALLAVVAPPVGVSPQPEGTWPADYIGRSFVDGASWWQFHHNGSTMFVSEREEAEAEAERRYGPPLSPVEPTPEPPTASKCGCGHPDCVLCYFDNKPRTVAAKHYEQPEESQAADASEASREQHEAQSRRWPDRVSSEPPAVSDAARTEEAEAGGTAPSAGAMVTPSGEPAPPAPAPCVWRKIETAPKDGTEVLLLGPDGSIDFGRWRADRKYAAGGVWRMRQWLYVFPDAVAWSPTPPVVGTAPQGGEQ